MYVEIYEFQKYRFRYTNFETGTLLIGLKVAREVILTHSESFEILNQMCERMINR